MADYKVYDADAIGLIANLSFYINKAANVLGLSAGMIAGAIAEEADNYFSSEILDLKFWGDYILDEAAANQDHQTLKESYNYVVQNNLIEQKSYENTYNY